MRKLRLSLQDFEVESFATTAELGDDLHETNLGIIAPPTQYIDCTNLGVCPVARSFGVLNESRLGGLAAENDLNSKRAGTNVHSTSNERELLH